MKRSSVPRKATDLSDSLHQRISNYAIAATAAGVGLLAITQPAEAEIVYNPTQHILGVDGVYQLDLTHDGLLVFQMKETQSGSMAFKIRRLAVNGPVSNGVVGFSNFSARYASALASGASIGSGQHFVTGGRFDQVMASVHQSDSVFYKYYGKFYNVGTRFLGMKFKIQGETHYGWVRVKVAFRGLTIKATITGYAYETIAGQSIKAGQTKDPDESNAEAPNASRTNSPPELATLGALALGWAGPASLGCESKAAGAPETKN